MTNSIFIGEVTEQCFGQRVLRSEIPVLVVIWTAGSRADQTFLKLLEEWAPQARQCLTILRLSAESSRPIAERFGIPLVRGLALFNRGSLCYQFMGDASRQELEELLARAGTLRRSKEGGSASGAHNVQPPQVPNSSPYESRVPR